MSRERFLQLVSRHPLGAALAAFAGAIVIALGAGTAMHFAAPSAPPFLVGTAVDGALAVAGLAIVAALGWFRTIGFVLARRGPGLRVLWIPVLVLVASAAFQHSFQLSGLAIFTALFVTLLIALAEETLFRGVILQLLLPRGSTQAVLVSALLFGVMHLLNAAGANVGSVLLQVGVAFGMGVTFAAVRLRIGTIAPLVILHAAFDFVSYAATNGQSGTTALSTTAVVFEVAVTVVMVAYGLFLIRGKRPVEGNRSIDLVTAEAA